MFENLGVFSLLSIDYPTELDYNASASFGQTCQAECRNLFVHTSQEEMSQDYYLSFEALYLENTCNDNQNHYDVMDHG
jgi:hypothetical protein